MDASGSTGISKQVSAARYGVVIGLMACFVLGILISTFYTLPVSYTHLTLPTSDLV